MLHSTRRPAAPGDQGHDPQTEIGALRQRLAAAEAAFVAIVQRSSDGILVVDAEGLVRFANPAAVALLGRSRADLVGADVGFAVVVGNVAEVELLRPHGDVVYAEMRVVPTDWDDQPCSLALLRDVTDRHRAEAELAERATHDHLTGLPNRFLLEDRLQHALDRLERAGGSMALFLTDLDDFKSVNDRWGHPAGDEVLVEAARRIRSVLRPMDTVARFGGDEFVLLCESTDQAEASELSRRLAQAFRTPFLVAGQEQALGLSVGFVVVDQAGASADALLAAADEQMYARKHGPRAASPVSTPLPLDETEDVVAPAHCRFTLYVAGVTARSAAAVQAVERLCQQALPAQHYSVRVVDVLLDVDEADAARIFVTPTLVRHEPLPAIRTIGDLSETEALAAIYRPGRDDA